MTHRPFYAGNNERLPEPLPADPFPLFIEWFSDAARQRKQPNPNAMSLATIDPDGRPSVRIVLCKQIDGVAGHIVFHTHYRGRKGRALLANPHAAAAFHWDALDRQVRIEGIASKSPESESDAYFKTRPWLSRVGAWASEQSEPVSDRRAMQERLDGALRRFGLDPAALPGPDAAMDIPRPPHWGGFRLTADRVELWAGADNRLHDRAEWRRTLLPGAGTGQPPSPQSGWTTTRLQP